MSQRQGVAWSAHRVAQCEHSGVRFCEEIVDLRLAHRRLTLHLRAPTGEWGGGKGKVGATEAATPGEQEEKTPVRSARTEKPQCAAQEQT